jgi:hypothetical protein
VSDVRFVGPPLVWCDEKVRWSETSIRLARRTGEFGPNQELGPCNSQLSHVGALCPNADRHVIEPPGEARS